MPSGMDAMAATMAISPWHRGFNLGPLDVDVVSRYGTAGGTKVWGQLSFWRESKCRSNSTFCFQRRCNVLREALLERKYSKSSATRLQRWPCLPRDVWLASLHRVDQSIEGGVQPAWCACVTPAQRAGYPWAQAHVRAGIF